MSEDQFVDAESGGTFNNKDEISFRGIVMEHLRRIAIAGSVEFHGGYNKVASNTVNSTIYQYVPNSRDIYFNTIRTFADFLLPHFDKEMSDKEEEILNELETKLNEVYELYENASSSERESTNWGDKKNNLKIVYHRKLLRELSKFLARKNYLDIGVYEE